MFQTAFLFSINLLEFTLFLPFNIFYFQKTILPCKFGVRLLDSNNSGVFLFTTESHSLSDSIATHIVTAETHEDAQEMVFVPLTSQRSCSSANNRYAMR